MKTRNEWLVLQLLRVFKRAVSVGTSRCSALWAFRVLICIQFWSNSDHYLHFCLTHHLCVNLKTVENYTNFWWVSFLCKTRVNFGCKLTTWVCTSFSTSSSRSLEFRCCIDRLRSQWSPAVRAPTCKGRLPAQTGKIVTGSQPFAVGLRKLFSAVGSLKQAIINLGQSDWYGDDSNVRPAA